MSFILWDLKLYTVLKASTVYNFRPPQHRVEKGNPFLHPLVTLCMINPRILLAARAHYWLQLAFNQNPQIPFHEAAPPGYKYIQGFSIPGAESGTYSCWVLYCRWLPSCQICQNLSARPLYSWESTAPSNFVLSANLLTIPYSPAPK